MSHRVAIVGGGPAGIVAAKSLLEVGLCPTVFEASSSLGGIWSSANRRTWKSLHTNLSKYTCSFSDFSWPKHESMFPSQESVNKYLNNYAQKFGVTEHVKYNAFVQEVKKTNEGVFQVRWSTKTDGKELEVQDFDDVIIATGFFTQTNHDSVALKRKNSKLQILTSDQYADAEDFKDRTVAIIGGSFSGFEIAADLCKAAKKVYHVIPRPVYVVPKLLPQDSSNPATSFLPLDFLFYELNENRLEEIQQEIYIPVESRGEEKNIERLFKTEQEITNTHKYFQGMMGSHLFQKRNSDGKSPLFLKYPGEKRSSFNSEEFLRQEIMNDKPFLAISEEYRNCLPSSKINLIPGRLTKIEDNQIYLQPSMRDSPISSECTLNQIIEANQEDLPPSTTLLPVTIDACILCTGFRPNLSFLDSVILEKINYIPEDGFAPFISYKDLFHSEVPGLFFVGMYKGPYFGVMELQARYIAELISGRRSYPSNREYLKELEFSTAIREQSRPRPQFPHSDYVGLMFDLARRIDSLPNHFEEIRQNRFITPFTFLRRDPKLATEMAMEIQEQIQRCQEGRNIPKVIISLLEGRKYRFQRQITNHLDGSSTQVSGSITFDRISSMPISRREILEMCSTCSIKSEQEKNPLQVLDCEGDDGDDRVFLLYREEGKIRLPDGRSFDVNQHYIYHFNEERNTLELFFCKRDQVELIDYHFLSLQLEREEGVGWVGRNEHPCVKDLYNAHFVFRLNGLEISNIQIDFDVHGPAKNYFSSTNLEL